MITDPAISAYSRSVRAELRIPRQKRRRVIEEIESHLQDAAAANELDGATRSGAVARAISELGPPDIVAAAFSEQVVPGPGRGAIVRWSPMVLPAVVFLGAAAVLGWTLTWIPDGLTTGQRVMQRVYLERALLGAALSYATYFSIRRARWDRAWRWAAWFCSACALLGTVGTSIG